MDRIIEKLIDNSSLALILVGAFILVTGATGGWSSSSLTIQVNEVVWQATLVVVGLLIALLGAMPLLRDGNVSSKTKKGRITERVFLDEPLFISASKRNILRIDGDFLLWEQCTIMLWVLVPSKEEGLRNAPTNRYILAHHTGQVKEGNYYKYYNQFCLRYSSNSQWQIVFSNNQAKYVEKSPTIEDGLVPGWHHFLISWDISRPKLLFTIDGLKSGSDIITSSFSSWPQKTSGKVSIGAWTTDIQGHYCETRLYDLVILNKYLEPTDTFVKEHLDKLPQE